MRDVLLLPAQAIEGKGTMSSCPDAFCFQYDEQICAGGLLNSGGASYVNEGNLEQCQRHLLPWLERLGYHGPLDLVSGSIESAVYACNCLYDLLNKAQSDADQKDLLRSELARAKSDGLRVDKKLERLEDVIHEKDRELSEMRSKMLQQECQFREDYQQLQRERDEYTRKCCSLERNTAKLENDIRRCQRDFEKLQEKYKSDIDRRARISAPQTSRYVNEIPAKNRRNSKPEQEGKVSVLEEENARLMEENCSLKRALLELRESLEDRAQEGVPAPLPLCFKLLTSDPPLDALQETRVHDQNGGYYDDGEECASTGRASRYAGR